MFLLFVLPILWVLHKNPAKDGLCAGFGKFPVKDCDDIYLFWSSEDRIVWHLEGCTEAKGACEHVWIRTTATPPQHPGSSSRLHGSRHGPHTLMPALNWLEKLEFKNSCVFLSSLQCRIRPKSRLYFLPGLTRSDLGFSQTQEPLDFSA